MSGGRFLVSLKDIQISEKIVKIKSLVKEEIDIDDSIKENNQEDGDFIALEESVRSEIADTDRIILSEDTREVSNCVAGYVARKIEELIKGCCDDQLVADHSEGDNYHQLLSRGGLKVPSQGLSEFVASGFAILDACSTIVRNSPLTARRAGEFILSKSLDIQGFCCETHEKIVFDHAIRIINNIYFNNQRKRSTETVLKDQVVAFKKNKRAKLSN